jgi:hypothetical protein
VAATFRPDGSLASVSFSAIPATEAQPARPPIDEPPPTRVRQDLDALTELPIFEDN